MTERVNPSEVVARTGQDQVSTEHYPGVMQYSLSGEKHAYLKYDIPASYLAEIFLPQLKLYPPDARIVDLGAGKGEIARFAAAEGYQVISLDLFSAGLLKLKEEQQGSQAVLGNAMKLPFADRSLDLLHAKDMLVHIPWKLTLLGEIQRVLKPGGRVLLATVDSSASKPVGYYATSAVKLLDLLRILDFKQVKLQNYRPTLKEFAQDWYGMDNLTTTRKIISAVKFDP